MIFAHLFLGIRIVMEAYSLSGAGGAIGVEPLTKNYGSKVGVQPPVPVPPLNKFLHYTPLGCYVT